MQRGFIIYFQLTKTIVFYLVTKVDGQVTRGNRDKCPVHLWIFIYYLLGLAYERKRPAIGGKIYRSLIIPEIGIAYCNI